MIIFPPENLLHELIDVAQNEDEIAMFINAAGVTPSQASIEKILEVDLSGTSPAGRN
jgi:hypothetical protein